MSIENLPRPSSLSVAWTCLPSDLPEGSLTTDSGNAQNSALTWSAPAHTPVFKGARDLWAHSGTFAEMRRHSVAGMDFSPPEGSSEIRYCTKPTDPHSWRFPVLNVHMLWFSVSLRRDPSRRRQASTCSRRRRDECECRTDAPCAPPSSRHTWPASDAAVAAWCPVFDP